MSHLHSLAQSMYIATFLPEHVLTTCFADYVTSTSGAIRLAFDDLPLASSRYHSNIGTVDHFKPPASRKKCALRFGESLIKFGDLVNV